MKTHHRSAIVEAGETVGGIVRCIIWVVVSGLMLAAITVAFFIIRFFVG